MRDALSRLRDLHARLAGLYAEAGRSVDGERARLLLDDMRREETAVTASLDRFLEEAEARVLGTWLQYEPDPELERALSAAHFESGVGPDAVFEQVLGIEARLASVHRQLAAASAAPAVEELFESLATLDRKRRERYAQDVLESEGGQPPL